MWSACFHLVYLYFSADIVPNSGDLSMTCGAVYNQRSDSHIVTLRMELNSAFTPAVIEAIRNLFIFRIEADSDGAFVLPGSREMLQVALDINATALNYEYRDIILPLAKTVEFHEYTVGQALHSVSKHCCQSKQVLPAMKPYLWKL